MYFYVLVIPILLGSLVMILHLWNMAKHDRVLYRFCHIRREIMRIMRDNNYNLSREDYFALRHLLEIVNNTIHNYNEFKHSTFNITKCIQYGRGMVRLDKQVQERQVKNANIARLYDEFGSTVFLALLAFIPWPQMALKIVPVIIKVLTKVGIDSVKSRAKRWLDFTAELKSRQREHAYHS
jgi:hypothetical protein